MKTRISILLCGVLLVALAGFAHGNEEHVLGTVTQVAEDSVTVKTTKGSVTIAITAASKITMNKVVAKLADIQVGDRIVIHATKNGAKLTANVVQFTHAAPAAKPS